MGIVIAGGFEERIGKDARGYQRGYVGFVPAGVTHSQRFGAAPTRQIVFRPEERLLDYLAGQRTPLDDAPFVSGISFGQLGDRLLREMRDADNFSVITCEGILLEIIASFGRVHEAGHRTPRPPHWLSHTRDFLHAEALSCPRMADVARAAGRHEVHVARAFRRFYGLSIGDYLRNLRLESAARGLADSRADICTVALECGFSNHSHLCREFRRRYGITPSQFRAQHTK